MADILVPTALQNVQTKLKDMGDGSYAPVISTGASGTSTAVAGDVASGATDSGNPVKVGGVYNSSPVSLTSGQRGNLQMDSVGSVRALPACNASYVMTDGYAGQNPTGLPDNNNTPRPLGVTAFVYNGSSYNWQRGDANGAVIQAGLSSTFWNYAAASGGIANTTTAVTIKTAAGAGVRNYLKTLTLAHDALGAATEIAIRDGAAGTVLWRGKLQTAAMDSVQAASLEFDPPLKGTANTLMEVVTLTAVTGGVYVNATGFTGV